MKTSGKKINFDDFATDYEAIINRHAKLAGGSLEYFIGVRLGIVAEMVGAAVTKAIQWNVVDFGCGIGATEIQMKDVFPRSKIVGLDVSATSITKAQKLSLANVTFQTIEPGKALPLADNSIDLAYSNGTFHHIPSSEHPFIFSELFRVLRPGGRIFIFENNFFNPVTVFAMKRNPFDADACLIAPPKMRRRIREAGFSHVRQGYYCFFLKPLTFLRFSERYLRWLPLGAQYYTWGVKN
ncbi:MAG: class I SAM-dependent methyltransferase [Nibricoccus sp.]